MGFLKHKNIFVVFSALIVMMLMYLWFKSDKPNMSNRILKIQMDKRYHGIVEKKFLDKNNHMDNTIFLNTSQKIVLPPRLYDLIMIQDSIYKERDSIKIYVKRNNEIIELKYDKSDFE